MRTEPLGIGQEQLDNFVIPAPHLDAAVLGERNSPGPVLTEPLPPSLLLGQPHGVWPGRLRIPRDDGPVRGSS